MNLWHLGWFSPFSPIQVAKFAWPTGEERSQVQNRRFLLMGPLLRRDLNVRCLFFMNFSMMRCKYFRPKAMASLFFFEKPGAKLSNESWRTEFPVLLGDWTSDFRSGPGQTNRVTWSIRSFHCCPKWVLLLGPAPSHVGKAYSQTNWAVDFGFRGAQLVRLSTRTLDMQCAWESSWKYRWFQLSTPEDLVFSL